MGYRAKEEANLFAQRGGDNQPLGLIPAAWDGHRSVRIGLKPHHRGLATTAYSFALTDDEKQEVARRIAALWNLGRALGLTTEEIEAMASKHDGETA